MEEIEYVATALDHGHVQFRSTDGTLVLGRYVGRDRSTREPIPGGEVIRVSRLNERELFRAAREGHISLVLVTASDAVKE